MKNILAFAVLVTIYSCNMKADIKADKAAILKVMKNQEVAWNIVRKLFILACFRQVLRNLLNLQTMSG